MPDTPERIYLQTVGERQAWTWADHETDASDTEYIRADLHPTNAHNAVVEAVRYLYSPTGTWLGEEMRQSGVDPLPRLWRLVQLVVDAPKPTGRQWPHIGLLRDMVSQLTGVTVEDVAGPLAEFLHMLRYPATEPPGMVITDLDAWEGEDGG